MSADGATLAFYEREAPDYCASGPEGASRYLDPFLDRLPPGSRVLELGCGSGRDAAAMIARGFDVTATDGSQAIALEAERRLGRTVAVLRFDELDERERFDAVWAHASLLHVSRAALPDVLARVWRALKPGGWHWASYKAGEAEGRDRFGRRFNFPDVDLLAASYRRAGEWTGVAIDGYEGSGYDGVARHWLGLTGRKLIQQTETEDANR